MSKCTACPRNCNVDRDISSGFCGANSNLKIARAALHFGEEPCISGENGSGAIFFSSCPLRCVFCQNNDISKNNFGATISVERLVEIFFELQEQGAHNINLVSPTQHSEKILQALQQSKNQLKIPVVYNTSGYEKVETLKMFDGLVDIYLPDLKYKSSILAKEYSKAEDYFEIASLAILEMFRQTGKYEFDQNNMLKKGVVIRHLVLPGTRNDSIDLMNWIGENFKKDDIIVSLMSQYTPEFYSGENKNLKRKLTTFEYHKVMDIIQKYEFFGYMQERSSASSSYTPHFNLEGVLKP